MSSADQQNTDLYDLLGVSKDATDKEIQRAYRKLALKYHPDRNEGDADAARKFKKGSEAYEILNDPEKRAAYDEGGMSRVQGAGFDGFADNEEIYTHFEDIFSEMFSGRGGRSRHAGPIPGHDLKFSLSVDFKIAALGGKTTINAPIPGPCKTCHGSGRTETGASEACETCRGSGQVTRKAKESGGYFSIASVCPACHGSGRRSGTPCPACHGEGREIEMRTIAVKIPPGTESGQSLRLRGQGQVGLRGGPTGDLIIEIKVEPHEMFRRDKLNIRSDVSVPLVVALLGGKVDVPTLRGTVSLTIPAGTSSDRILRIRGQGIEKKNTKGDHLVRIVVEIPKLELGEEEITSLRQQLEPGKTAGTAPAEANN